jgi:flagellar basal-body rod protein FlgC
MLYAVSSALSGLSVASLRLVAVYNDIANKDSRGALPSAGAPIAQQPHKPVEVESAATGFGGAYATLRSITPAYLAVYDGDASYADGDGFVAAPNVDPATEMVDAVGAAASFTASVKTLQAVDDMVRRLYDLA